jgi:hypothetical protein
VITHSITIKLCHTPWLYSLSLTQCPPSLHPYPPAIVTASIAILGSMHWTHTTNQPTIASPCPLTVGETPELYLVGMMCMSRAALCLEGTHQPTLFLSSSLASHLSRISQPRSQSRDLCVSRTDCQTRTTILHGIQGAATPALDKPVLPPVKKVITPTLTPQEQKRRLSASKALPKACKKGALNDLRKAFATITGGAPLTDATDQPVLVRVH